MDIELLKAKHEMDSRTLEVMMEKGATQELRTQATDLFYRNI